MTNLRSFSAGSAVLLAAAMIGAAIAVASYNNVGGGLLALLLILAIAFVSFRTWAKPANIGFVRLVALALAAKLAFGGIRYIVTYEIFGAADAARYSSAGVRVAQLARDLEFAAIADMIEPGTAFPGIVTGFVYLIIGESVVGAFLVFSCAAFIGTVLFLQAFRTAFPQGRWYLFALLIFFEPTILYWPSGTGKDALVFFFAGVASFGVALLFAKGRKKGALLMVLGLAGVFFVRPEAAMVLAAAVAPASLVASTKKGPHRVPALAISVVMLLGGVWFATGGASALGLPNITPASALEFIAAQAQTDYDSSGSGSNFRPTAPNSPLWVPMAFVTVLLRPFPFEANSLQVLLQSLEGPLLAAILLWNARNIWRSITNGWRDPYLLFNLIAVVVLVLGMSTIGNFGLLARQRAIVFPFLFALVCYRDARANRNNQAGATHDGQPAKPRGLPQARLARRW